MYKVLFDDVFFNLSNSGVARYWKESLLRLSGVKHDNYEFIILNRSDKLDKIGFKTINFPEFSNRFVSADRLNIAKVCEVNDIDLFISSFFTFSPNVKNLAVVYDLIPENFCFSDYSRDWQSRKCGIYCASHYLAISKNTKKDLLDLYNFIDPKSVSIAIPGVNSVFGQKVTEPTPSEQMVSLEFQDYVMLVGSRFQTENYKNCGLVYEAIKEGLLAEMSLIVIGGEELSQYEIETCRDADVAIIRLVVNDHELASLYMNAVALVYPSLYEGFGMPPLEALAMGTPVITTSCASLPESVGELSVYISGYSTIELKNAIEKCKTKDWREFISEKGPRWAEKFSWHNTALEFDNAIQIALKSPAVNIDIREILMQFTKDSAILQE